MPNPAAFKPDHYAINLLESDFHAVALFMRELGRIMDEHHIDLDSFPKATLKISVITTNEAGKAALEAFLDDMEYSQAPVEVEATPYDLEEIMKRSRRRGGKR